MAVHQEQIQALRDWAHGDSSALDRPVLDERCPDCDECEAATWAEYLEAWKQDFPQAAKDWNRSWQTCPRCLDSTCDGDC